jgi:hypothetical protein
MTDVAEEMIKEEEENSDVTDLSSRYDLSRGVLMSHFTSLCLTRSVSLSRISDVCTKYQEAAKIVNLALTGLVSQCLPGATILQLCEFGHTVIQAGVSKLYTKKVNGIAMDRGVAFPVCISVNHIVCNHSPLVEEERVRAILACTIRIGIHRPTLLGSRQACHDGSPLCLATQSG